MLGFPIARDRTEGILSFLALLLAVTLLGSLAVGGDTTLSRDDWKHFVGVGDTFARKGGTTEVSCGWPAGHPRLAARTAYLLAFQDAQDSRDVAGILTAADRLASAGEPQLAAHARRVARIVAAQVISDAGAHWRGTNLLRII